MPIVRCQDHVVADRAWTPAWPYSGICCPNSGSGSPARKCTYAHASPQTTRLVRYQNDGAVTVGGRKSVEEDVLQVELLVTGQGS